MRDLENHAIDADSGTQKLEDKAVFCSVDITVHPNVYFCIISTEVMLLHKQIFFYNVINSFHNFYIFQFSNIFLTPLSLQITRCTEKVIAYRVSKQHQDVSYSVQV